MGGGPRRRVPVLLLGSVIVLGAAVFATGLAWPGWMRQEIPGTPSAVVDRSTPEGTARGVVDALNRRDVRKFVDELVCRDGRRLTVTPFAGPVAGACGAGRPARARRAPAAGAA